MFKYDYSSLLGKIKETGYTQETLAKEIGLSACSLNQKLNNLRSFKQSEMSKICKAISIDFSQIGYYFFTLKV